MKTLYQEIAQQIYRLANDRLEIHQDAKEKLENIESELLPSGSGIDQGTSIDLEKSTKNKLVLTMGFHHMDEHGGYDGWTEHVVTLHPSLLHTVDITISGPNRNDIKDYLHDVYHHALTSEFTP